MIDQKIIAALDLPAGALVNQRVPKKMLMENGASTSADKRIINDGIEEIHWIATLKSANIGVPEYRDEARTYLEIVVLHIVLRPDAKAPRIAELTHRTVPYPLILLLSTAQQMILSLAHIRWAQNEAGKVVVDGEPVQVSLNDQSGINSAFLQALSLAWQPRNNLWALYQSWFDTLLAYQAALLTGKFVTSTNNEQAAIRRASLWQYKEIEQRIAALKAAATREKQLVRQIALNLEIKQLQARQQEVLAQL